MGVIVVEESKSLSENITSQKNKLEEMKQKLNKMREAQDIINLEQKLAQNTKNLELLNEIVDGVQDFCNNGNNSKHSHFDLYNKCKRYIDFIQKFKEEEQIKNTLSLWKLNSKTELTDFDEPYDFAMNCFRQYVLKKQKENGYQNGQLVNIKDFFTRQDLIDLGGENFIKDCYAYAYENARKEQRIPPEYLKLTRDDNEGFWNCFVDELDRTAGSYFGFSWPFAFLAIIAAETIPFMAIFSPLLWGVIIGFGIDFLMFPNAMVVAAINSHNQKESDKYYNLKELPIELMLSAKKYAEYTDYKQNQEKGFNEDADRIEVPTGKSKKPERPDKISDNALVTNNNEPNQAQLINGIIHDINHLDQVGYFGLYDTCKNQMNYIRENKNTAQIKGVKQFWKSKTELINFEKPYEFAMNCFKQYVFERQYQDNDGYWKNKIVPIKKLFTNQELIKLGGEEFIQDCYKNIYGASCLDVIPKQYLTPYENTGFWHNIKNGLGRCEASMAISLGFGTLSSILTVIGIYVMPELVFSMSIVSPLCLSIICAAWLIGTIVTGATIGLVERKETINLNLLLNQSEKTNKGKYSDYKNQKSQSQNDRDSLTNKSKHADSKLFTIINQTGPDPYKDTI